MQHITIKKKGIYFSFWDEPTTSWVNRNIIEAGLPITWYLSYIIKFDGILTVRDILSLLKPYIEHVQLIFANNLGGLHLQEIYELLESNKIPPKDLPMNCVQLFKMGEASPIEADEYPYLNVHQVIMGLQIENNLESDNLFHLSPYDIRDWCDLELGIDGFLDFTDTETEDVLFTGIVGWKLYEMICAILSQISISMLVTQTTKVKELKSPLESGPLTFSDLIMWFEELDLILLAK